MYNIHLLPASFGDSILIEYGESTAHYILIDGGPFSNYEEMISGLRRVAPAIKGLELLVITHIDIDHIDGIITLLKGKNPDFEIRDIWFNGQEEIKEASDLLAPLQGEYITALIKEKKLPHNKAFQGKPVVVRDYKHLPVIKLEGGMSLTLLNPGLSELAKLHGEWLKKLEKFGKEVDFLKLLDEDHRYIPPVIKGDDLLGDTPIKTLQKTIVEPDTSTANLSSIAFIATWQQKTCLFAGDAPSHCLLKAIDPMLETTGTEKIQLDAWKLAHHGSKKSTVDSIMKKIMCRNILVSSDGARYKHPDEVCLAKLLLYNASGQRFYFNYKTDFNKRWAKKEEQNTYKFTSFYPTEDTNGISIKL